MIFQDVCNPHEDTLKNYRTEIWLLLAPTFLLHLHSVWEVLCPFPVKSKPSRVGLPCKPAVFHALKLLFIIFQLSTASPNTFKVLGGKHSKQRTHTFHIKVWTIKNVVLWALILFFPYLHHCPTHHNMRWFCMFKENLLI